MISNHAVKFHLISVTTYLNVIDTIELGFWLDLGQVLKFLS